jgi:hypothetical protein
MGELRARLEVIWPFGDVYARGLMVTLAVFTIWREFPDEVQTLQFWSGFCPGAARVFFTKTAPEEEHAAGHLRASSNRPNGIEAFRNRPPTNY